jgi:NAD(P)H-dependent FMN reductase
LSDWVGATWCDPLCLSLGKGEHGPGRKRETKFGSQPFCGSLRQGSYTRLALQVALRGARETGAEASLIDLRESQLIFCDGKENEGGYPKDVFRLREEVKRAHGVILGTPEYHGGLSGVLKNALDLMGFEELEGKMIGLVGVSGGTLGAVHALSHLRSVGRALHAWVIPEQAAVTEAWKVFDESGNPKNLELEKSSSSWAVRWPDSAIFFPQRKPSNS